MPPKTPRSARPAGRPLAAVAGPTPSIPKLLAAVAAAAQHPQPPRDHSFAGTYAGKRVLVTGHTGFKGAWLSEWLLQLGAEVTGLALPPPTSPALFDQLGLASRLNHLTGDIRDAALVARVVRETKPQFVFHLAAQSLVRHSYAHPLETYATNVMGTAHVLEALRLAGTPCAAVMVTTDKCYENRESAHRYHEEDPLGGHDPYSSSKGAAELVIAAYRRSYFSGNAATPATDPLKSTVRVASARAGNVIGGGDWATDRIVPDCIRALQAGQPIPVRNKSATRPWQHVLEPLSGYLWLAACLANPRLAPTSAGEPDFPLSGFSAQLCSAFNFGPSTEANRTVAALVQTILQHWPGKWEEKVVPGAVHEATLLQLAIDKAEHLLGWKPVWDFDETVRETVAWYRIAAAASDSVASLTRRQIADYATAAAHQGLAWARTEKLKTES